MTKSELENLISTSEFSESVFGTTKTDSEYIKAREQAVRSIGSNFGRSRRQVSNLLIKKGYERNLAIEVAADLAEAGYADDTSAANRVILRHNRGSSTKGRPVLQQMLYQIGIERKTAKLLLDELPSELMRAVALVNAVAHRYDDEHKLLRFMAMRGFSYSTAKEAIGLIEEGIDHDE